MLCLAALCLGKCGGYHIGPLQVGWARDHEEYTQYVLRTTLALGVVPELTWAPSVQARWEATRKLLAQLETRSVLDVGGIGSYRSPGVNYTCVNVASERRAGSCERYDGSYLPFETEEFEIALAESTLHHAAQNSTRVLAEMGRVATRFVVVGEDVLEREASLDVRRAFRQHDPKARYRSLEKWADLGRDLGLRLVRLIVLNRVPLHVSGLPSCRLGYAPMAYLVFKKT